MGVPVSIPDNSLELLHYHLELSNVKSATEMIPTFINIPQDVSLTTSLMIAARKNQIDLIPLLLEELNAQDCTGQCSLHKALIFNKKEAAELLLAEKDITDKSLSTSLHFAAMGGCTALIPALNTGEIDTDDLLRTPLMKAAMYRKIDCVRLLIAQTSHQDDNGLTACALAAQRGYPEIVAELIGEEGGIVDQMGRSLVQIAEQSEQYLMVAYLMNGCEGFSGGKYSKGIIVKAKELQAIADKRKQEHVDEGDNSGSGGIGSGSVIGGISMRQDGSV